MRENLWHLSETDLICLVQLSPDAFSFLFSADIISFFVAEYSSTVCVYHVFIYSSLEGHQGWLHNLVIIIVLKQALLCMYLCDTLTQSPWSK